MTAASSLYKGHRYPGEIIAHCGWLYHRFPLSFGEVEELMLQRRRGQLRNDPGLVREVRAGLRQPERAGAGPAPAISGTLMRRL